MSVNINDFRAIAGSSKSIGYVGQEIGKDGHVKLTKLEAHRHLRNVTKAGDFGVEYHGEMRKAFLEALAGSFTAEQRGNQALRGRIDTFLATARELLGLTEADGVVPEAGDKPLDRRDVRALLMARDLTFATYSDDQQAFVTEDGRMLNLSIGPDSTKGELLDAYATAQLIRKTASSSINVSRIIDALECHFCANYDRFGGNPMLTKMLANYPRAGLNDHGAEAQQVRRLATGILTALSKGKIQKADFQGVSAAKLQRLATLAASGQRDIETIRGELAEKDELNQTNCGEVLDIVNKFDKAKAEEREAIKLSFKAPSQPQPQKAAAQQPAENQQPPTAFGVTTDDIRNFFADLISDSDTLALDREQAEISAINAEDPDEKADMAAKIRREHLKEVFFSHNKELAVLLTDEPFVQSLPDDLKEMAKNVKNAAKPFFLLNAKALDDAERTANALLAVDKSSGGCNFVFNLLQSVLDKAVKTQVTKLQDIVSEQFATIMGNNDDEVKLSDLIGGNATGYKSIDDILEKLVSHPKKDGALKVTTGYDQNEFGRYDTWKLTLPDGQTFSVEKGEIADASPLTEEGRAKNPALFKQEQDDVEERRLQQKADRLRAGKAVLEYLSGLIAADSRHGYGALMAEAMKRYFKDMSEADQRALIAAGIRFMKPDKVCPEGASDEERQKIADENEGAKLGALLKGAGPVMQKMLQGLSAMTTLPASFKVALADMRSNLAPIPQRVVKALLLELKRQNPNVVSIDAIESKGAASVGQTFRCNVKIKDGDNVAEKEVIVKLIRPDAEIRCQRERKIFEEAAREVDKRAAAEQGKTLGEDEKGGMQITFAGQLAGIMDELDLRKEAENVEKGGVYDAPGHGLSSMKLDPAFKPTKFAMVVTKASGDPLDRVVQKFRDEISELTKPFDNDIADPEDYSNTVDKVIANGKRLTTIHQQLLVHQRHLVELAKKWCDEGIYKGGFYHGDLHAGNIMVDTEHFKTEGGFLKRREGPNGSPGPLDLEGDEGITVIDFGNAEDLGKEDRVNVLRMIAAAAARDTNRFMQGFKALMTSEGQAKFEAQRPALHDMIHNVFNLGKMEQSGNRIAVVLGALQQLGFELPAPIFRFSQCQVRLQTTIDEVNELIDQVGVKIANLRPNNMSSFQGYRGRAFGTDPLAAVLYGNFSMLVGRIEQVKTQIARFLPALDVDPEAGVDSPPAHVGVLKDNLLTMGSTDDATIKGNLDKFAGNLKRLEGFKPQGTGLKAAFDAMRENVFTDEKVRQLEEKITREKNLGYEISILTHQVGNLEFSEGGLTTARHKLDLFKAARDLEDKEKQRANRVLQRHAAAQSSLVMENGANGVSAHDYEQALIEAIKSEYKSPEERAKFLVEVNGETKLVGGLTQGAVTNVLIDVADGAPLEKYQKAYDDEVRKAENTEQLNEKRQELNRCEDERRSLQVEIEALKNEFSAAFAPIGKLFCAVEKAALEQLLEAYGAIEGNLDMNEKDDFCSALGAVIKENKGSSLWDLGIGTVIEYSVTGKLKG